MKANPHLDFVLCSIPTTTFGGLEPYTAPTAARAPEDAVMASQVPDPEPIRGRVAEAHRYVGEETLALVAGELWAADYRTSISITRGLRANGHQITHRHVNAALERLRATGKATRIVNKDRHRNTRWLWRKK